MNYIFWLSCSLILLIFIFLLFSFFTNRNLSNKTLKYIFVFLIIALSLMAYTIQPNITNDSYRHFEEIDIIRKYGFFKSITYNNCFVFKIILYIVSLLPSNQFLHMIGALVDYSIFAYIICDYKKNYSPSPRVLIIAILMSFSLVNFSTVISGFRNAMSIALLCLVFYDLLVKKRKIDFKLVILTIIALLIHPISYFVVFIYVFYRLFSNSIYKFTALFWSLIVGLLIKVFELLCLDFFADKLSIYSESNWIDDIRLFYVSLAYLIFTCIIYLIFKNSNKVKNKEYTSFMIIYIMFIFGSVFVAKIFVKRMLILLAFGSIPFVDNIDNLGRKKIIVYYVYLFFIGGLIIYNMIEIKGNMIIPFNWW